MCWGLAIHWVVGCYSGVAIVEGEQSKLCLTSGHRTEEDKEFMLYSILKMIFMEQV